VEQAKSDRFDNLSPEKKAALLALLAQKRTNSSGTTTITRITREASINQAFPLSYSQEIIWLAEQFFPNKCTYNLCNAYRFTGPIKIDLMNRSLNALIKRHEIWRTVFGIQADKPVQYVLPSVNIDIELVNIEQLEREQQQRELDQWIYRDMNTPFSLENGPLVRAKLLKLNETEYILILGTHHIVNDGWSYKVIFKDLAEYYNSLVDDREPKLDELAVQYIDYAVWQRNRLHGDILAEKLNFWKEHLHSPLTILELPTDRPRPLIPTQTGDTRRFTIGLPVIKKMRILGQQEGCTLFMILLAAFKVLLYRYTGQTDIIVGSPVANRNYQETEDLIGCFINTLILRTKFSGETMFYELLQSIKKTTLEAFNHHDLPFEKIVDELKLERDLSHRRVFQVLFNYQNNAGYAANFKDLKMESLKLIRKVVRFDLTLSFWEADKEIFGVLLYNTDLFNEETIDGMINHYCNILNSALENPSLNIGKIPLLTQAEFETQIIQWNQTQKTYPGIQSVSQIFEEQVKQSPQAIAVICNDKQYTYHELNERANRLAHYLIAAGVGPEAKIALFMERSLDIVVGILGILKAGGAYVPLDPNYPPERIRMLLEEIQAVHLVTQSHLAAELPLLTGLHIFCIDTGWPAAGQYSPENPGVHIAPQNLMYVLFTSGSTGRPKGVMVEHRNFINFFHGIMARINPRPGMNFAIVTTFAADLGLTMLWGALCTGGTLHVFSYESAIDPAEFRKYFKEHRIDYLKIVPSHFATLQEQEFFPEILPRHCLIFAGEACDWGMINKIKLLNPVCMIQNSYGPTETTVTTLTYSIDYRIQQPQTATVPLGRPLGNTRIYILDSNMQPTPVGVPGELYIGGDGVSRGYLNSPELTAAKFIPDPFFESGRLYRTGDLVKYLPGGNIEFLGRIDKQVKIRGYRIELGEIEHEINAFPGVKKAVVILREDSPGDKRLAAYIAPAGTVIKDVFSVKIRDYLRQRLPDYMIPVLFIIMEAIPVTANGKIDYAKLPAPDKFSNSFETTFVPPRNDLEKRIAAIWAEVLKLEQVGIDDSFFDLGGESFKAIRVVRKIDPTLSVIELFKNPTIRQLAELLTKGEKSDSSLLHELTKPVSEQEKIANLICIPHGGGSAIIYQSLADALPVGYSLYALAIPGHDFSRPEEPLTSLEKVAECCVSEIKQKITGPIILYGHCLGGALTIEIAGKLEQHSITVLGVFEAANFPSPRLPGKFFDLWTKIFPRERFISNLTYQDMLKRFGGLCDDLDPMEVDFVIRGLRHDACEAEDYYTKWFATSAQPKIKAPITCIVGTKDRMTEFYEERYHEWEYFSNEVDLQVIKQAGHYFQKNLAVELAQIIHEKVSVWLDSNISGATGAIETGVQNIDSRTAALSKGQEKNTSGSRKLPPQFQLSLTTFLMVAFGQLVSLIGSSMTSFALGIWVFQRTGSALDFTLISTIAAIPAILMLPIAGGVADRWNKRWVMIVTNIIAALSVSMVAVLFWSNALLKWHIYVAATLSSLAGTFQRPAYLSAVSQLVPKRYLGQANGIVQLAASTGQMLAPILGGALVVLIGLNGIISIDLFSFIFIIIVLAVVRFPNTMYRIREETMLKEIVGGWNYIIKRSPLVTMILYFIVFNLLYSISVALITPLVLSFGTPVILGIVTSAAGIGGILGSLLMSIWGGTKRRADGMVGYVILTGISILITGLKPDLWFPACGVLGTWFSVSLINAHWQTIIQNKVGLELQGRIFATNQMLAWSATPLGYALSGFLADKVFEPLMVKGRPLANVFGGLIGVGHGRGIGLMMVILGFSLFIWGILGFNYRKLRYMEKDLPDAVLDAIITDDKDQLQSQADQLYVQATRKTG
jgi:amino acid adenylation domain-containing protein